MGKPALFFFFTLFALSVSAKHHHSKVLAPAPAPAVDCSSLVLQLASCVSYVSSENTTSTPDADCCSGLRNVLETAGLETGQRCLCDSFNSAPQSGMALNKYNSEALPAACNVSTFSLTSCHAPAPAPVQALSPVAISPRASGTENPTSADVGSSEVAPAPGPGSSGSGSSSLAASVELLVLTAIAAVFFTSLY